MFDMRAGMWNSEEGLPWIATSLYDNYNIQLLIETLLNRRLQHDTSTQRCSFLLCFTTEPARM
jgi:hypothetical protein